MRIGYESMLTGTQDTGVGVAIRETLEALLSLDEDDSYVVFSHQDAAKYLPRSPRAAYHLSPGLRWGRLPRIYWQQCRLRQLVSGKGIDLYHATGYVAAAALPVPTVVSVYDTIALERPELTRRANAAHYRWAVPRGLYTASRIVVPTEYVRGRLETLYPQLGPNIQVVPLGISDCFCRGDADERRPSFEQHGILPGKYFLCVGTLERKKNFGVVLRAFAQSIGACPSGTQLVIAGKPGNDSRRIKSSIKRLGLEDKVVLTGYVPVADLVALYDGAAALLHPSLEEGFGFPPLEAMACGTPVAASNVGALRETTAGHARLVSPDDVDAWAAAMEELIRNEAPMNTAGMEHAQRLRWRDTAQKLREVYREVVTERHARISKVPRQAPSL